MRPIPGPPPPKAERDQGRLGLGPVALVDRSLARSKLVAIHGVLPSLSLLITSASQRDPLAP